MQVPPLVVWLEPAAVAKAKMYRILFLMMAVMQNIQNTSNIYYKTHFSVSLILLSSKNWNKFKKKKNILNFQLGNIYQTFIDYLFFH